MNHILKKSIRNAIYMASSIPPISSRRMSYIRRNSLTVVLNLHRIVEDHSSSNVGISPNSLKELVSLAKKHFEIRCIQTMDEPSDLPVLVFSFDDGYKDFLDYAVPIFDSENIRANQNVICASVITGRAPFNVLIQHFIRQAPMDVVKRLDWPDVLGHAPERIPAIALSRLIKNRPIEEMKAIEAQMLPNMLEYGEFSQIEMMTEDDLKQIKSHHEIGAHSYEHASMEYETDEYLQNDLARCGSFFTETLNQQMSIYCLPNGSYRDTQLKYIRSSGVSKVLCVGEDFHQPGLQNVMRFSFETDGYAQSYFRITGAKAQPFFS